MRTVFKGKVIDVKVKKENLREKVQRLLGVEIHTNSLVQYDPKKNVVTVDARANENYQKYAVIHECICCGKYGYLAPQVDDPSKRCAEIDKMLMAEMPTQLAENYRKMRIEMFNTLLDKQLYGSEGLRASFENSLEILQDKPEEFEECDDSDDFDDPDKSDDKEA
ncbi:hypothetical protein J6T21_03040 [Candidatus Saccharibacteria bacterium]|nr:hypothetical protein [Candidatus Saccharibacteria bacterium]